MQKRKEVKRWQETGREKTGKRIKEVRYNKWYKEVKVEGVPGYVKKGRRDNRWRRVIR